MSAGGFVSLLHCGSCGEGESMNMTILDFPPEILAYILSFLPRRELPNASLVCRQFAEASKIDLVWQTRCWQDYSFKRFGGWTSFTYRDIYSKVLYHYGDCIGLWQLNIESYGGLLHIRYEHDGIRGVQLLSPIGDVYGDMREKPLFTISLNPESNDVSVQCNRGYSKPTHGCEITLRKRNFGYESRHLEYHCCNPDAHRHPGGKHREFEEWMSQETGDAGTIRIPQELLLMKYLSVSVFDECFSIRQLQIPSALGTDPPCLLSPGLYKGNFGSHGVEAIMLRYSEAKQQLTGVKVIGDPNVPAGKVSMYVDLSRPMILTADQQESVGVLAEIDIPDVHPDIELNRLPEQPFVVPFDCMERGNVAPRTCKARFHARGQIAGNGYTNPSFIPIHIAVFDRNTFGIVWLLLHSFSIFSRVTEDLTRTSVNIDAG